MRRLENCVRFRIDFSRDRNHRVHELIEFALRLSLRWLDHERAVHNQRKADGIRMKTVIDEALGHVAGAHALRRLPVVAEDYFVHVRAIVR